MIFFSFRTLKNVDNVYKATFLIQITATVAAVTLPESFIFCPGKNLGSLGRQKKSFKHFGQRSSKLCNL